MAPLRGFTIGGIMWVTVVLAVGLAALRNLSAMWVGIAFLVTLGVLACAVVAVAGRPADERPWWSGFALFGGGYFWLAFWGIGSAKTPTIPTTEVLIALAPWFHVDPPPVPVDHGGMGGGFGGGPSPQSIYYAKIGHCVWALVLGALGAMATLAICTMRRRPVDTPRVAPEHSDEATSTWRRRPALIALVGAVWLILFTVVGYHRNPELLAGGAYLVTCVLVGSAILGAVFCQGRLRAEWLGAALFAGGYLALHMSADPDDLGWWSFRPANAILSAVRPVMDSGGRMLHGPSSVYEPANARLRRKLEQCIPMSFSNETPLEDVLKYIKRATLSPGDQGIPFYIDPIGLQGAERTMQSPIQMDLEGIPLRTTLHLLLKQLGLTYHLRDGLLIITFESSDDFEQTLTDDPFFVAGHCILAWLAAALGALIAPRVAGSRREAVA